ncbi:MAG: YcgJ family protein [Cyanobacteriota bacterium]|nr:YcgJ family protein [Cyanobacteriota bacterium]
MVSSRALGSLVGLLVVAASPLAASAQSVQSPAPGVLCDPQGLRGSGVCYDANGVSLPQTARHLGRRAEAQLRAYLAGNPSPQEFRLSNGTVCSVPARTCWEDGWTRRNVSQRLTRQLFSASAAPDPGPSGDGWSGANAARDTGLCSLSRGSRAVFDGRCDLRQINRGDGVSRYRVRLANGTTYVFTNRGGSVSIADDFGSTWPVTYVNHGATGLFRWAEMSLVATQTAGRDASTLPEPGAKDELGRALGTLLNTLFR